MYKPRKQIDADERWELFRETFGNEFDGANALGSLVRACADYMTRILGPAPVDAAMPVMLAPLCGDKNWREDLDAETTNLYSEWALGQKLHDLTAYATYGIFIRPDVSPESRKRELGGLVKEAAEFLACSPLELWDLADSEVHELTLVVNLAVDRWALDNGNAVTPSALAYFGGVSEGRIRNLMAGSDSKFTNENGRVPAHEALAWLSERDEYWPSIWQEHRDLYSDLADEKPLSDATFVPVARDGSVFHPGLRSGGGYTIGRKGNEQKAESFDEALRVLHQMPKPAWRRPNDNGNRGIVSGIRWARLARASLDAVPEGSNFRLPDSD